MKLLDKIKNYFEKKTTTTERPKFAVKGQCKIIEPYDLEVDFRERMREEEEENKAFNDYEA